MSDSPAPRGGASIAAATLASQLDGAVVGADTLRIEGVNAIDDALPSEVTFAVDEAHLNRWVSSRAGVVIAQREATLPEFDHSTRCAICVDNVDLAVIRVLEMFQPADIAVEPGVHPLAAVDDSATIGEGSSIAAHVSIGAGSRIGEDVVLHPGVRIGRNVQVGEGCVLHSNVSVRDGCRLGARVILHAGVVIGTDGFGYRPSDDQSHLVKVPHLGSVVLGDDVEIGANSCIDRGKFGATSIGAGTKIDNLVQVGHNCRIGRHCVIAGMAGISGSVTMGDWVQVGGGVGIADHLTLGSGCRIAARSAVMRDVAPGETIAGIPAAPAKEAFRQLAAVRKLDGWMREVNRALKRLSG